MLGGDWSRLGLLLHKWHAEEAWLASLIIRAKTNGENERLLAKANSIVESVFAADEALV